MAYPSLLASISRSAVIHLGSLSEQRHRFGIAVHRIAISLANFDALLACGTQVGRFRASGAAFSIGSAPMMHFVYGCFRIPVRCL
jgi:hypothetical protein